MAYVDLNADLGEGMLGDAALLTVVTSANVACGGHAGDAATMRRTLAAAQQHGVTVGAHPGWADPAHFGRRAMPLSAESIRTTLQTQVAALVALGQVQGWPVKYVKLHGALANQVAADDAAALAVGNLLREVNLGWLVMPLTAMHRAALLLDVVHYCEAFADRTYTADGHLTPRTQEGAVLHDADAIAARALEMVRRQALPTNSGAWLAARIDSLCVHGDTPDALDIAHALRQRLEAERWQVRALHW